MKKPDLRSFSKILICSPIGIGNYLMVQPTIENLSQELGTNVLHLLALNPGITKMGLDSNHFHQVISWYPDSQSLVTGVKIIAALRRQKFDAIISLFGW